MSKVVIDLNHKQVEKIVESLPLQEKLQLVRKLESETWANKLDSVVQRMRQQVRKAKVSDRDIDRLCEEVKREYDETHHRH